MKHHWIHNEIAVSEETIETVASNGKLGDERIELKKGARVDGAGCELWLSTNGDPVVVTVDETEWSCHVDDAAELVGMTADELRAMMEST